MEGVRVCGGGGRGGLLGRRGGAYGADVVEVWRGVGLVVRWVEGRDWGCVVVGVLQSSSVWTAFGETPAEKAWPANLGASAIVGGMEF